MTRGEQRIRFEPAAVYRDGLVDVLRKVVEKTGQQETGAVHVVEGHATVHGLENGPKRFNRLLPAIRCRGRAFGPQKRQPQLRLQMVRIRCDCRFKGLRRSLDASFQPAETNLVMQVRTILRHKFQATREAGQRILPVAVSEMDCAQVVARARIPVIESQGRQVGRPGFRQVACFHRVFAVATASPGFLIRRFRQGLCDADTVGGRGTAVRFFGSVQAVAPR